MGCQVCKSTPCFLASSFLMRLIREFTRVAFSCCHAPHSAIGLEIRDCFFVHCQRMCTCRNRICVTRRFCCPESLQIQIPPQHIIREPTPHLHEHDHKDTHFQLHDCGEETCMKQEYICTWSVFWCQLFLRVSQMCPRVP